MPRTGFTEWMSGYLDAVGSEAQQVCVDLVGNPSDPTVAELHPFGEPAFCFKAPKM